MVRALRISGLVAVTVIVTVALAYFLGSKVGGYIGKQRAESQYLEKRAAQTKAVLALAKGLEIGTTIPDHMFVNLDGDSISLHSLFGEKTVVSIVASGCGGCDHLLNTIADAADSTEHGCFVFISESGYQDMVEIPQTYGLYSPVVYDAESEYVLQFFETLVYPTVILVDRSGRIEKLLIGSLTEDEIREVIDANSGA